MHLGGVTCGHEAWLKSFTNSEFDPATLLTAVVIERGATAARSLHDRQLVGDIWRKNLEHNVMSDTAILISALETAPGVIIPLIREVPPQILKRRPSPAKWSAYEHACHLAQSDAPFLARLEMILSTDVPYIRSIRNSPEDEAGALLEIDLDERLHAYARERVALVERLRKLSPEEWQKTAEHEAFDHYSVFIMFRHLLNHEMLHAYRIEELLLKKDWD